MLYRISRPDMGYFRWSLESWRGRAIIVLDIFALTVSVLVAAATLYIQFFKK